MAERINLKEIERKVYTSYHQDGVVDISIAFIVLGFGVIMALDAGWMGGIVAIIGVSFYAVAKKTLTVPRIGFVKFGGRVQAMLIIAIVVGSLFMLLGVVAFVQFESGGTPSWLLFTIEHSMLVIGVAVAALFCATGYTFRIGRMYAYALLTLTIFIIGYFLSYPLYYYMILLGTLILLFGLALLIRFIRRYSLSTTRSMGDSSNEE